MPLHSFIPEIEQLKTKLSDYLSTGPENFSLTWNKFDALLSLIWYIKDTSKIKKLVFNTKSKHQDIILKIAKLLKLETKELSFYPNISEIKNTVSEQDLLIISNPIYPLGCNMPVKRIAKLSTNIGFEVIFDISLSFYWLGYDLYKTQIKYAIFSLDRFNPGSSPVVLFHREFNLKYLISPIEHWSYDKLEIDFMNKDKLLEPIKETNREITEIFKQFKFKQFCKTKTFPLLLNLVAPYELDIKKLTSLLQFNDIKFEIIDLEPPIIVLFTGELITQNNINEKFEKILEKLF